MVAKRKHMARGALTISRLNGFFGIVPPVRGATARVLAACIFVLFASGAARAGEPLLHCRWLSPNDRSRLDIMFSSNPMIIMLPGESLTISPEAAGMPVRIAILRDGQAICEDASLTLSAPEKPGSYYIPLALWRGEAKREVELCVLVPYKATAKRTDKGLDLRVDGQEIGHYRHPGRSGNAKVKRNPDSYQPPVWWLRITPGNAHFEVMPGLTAGELVVPSEDTGERHIDLVPVHYPMWQTIRTVRDRLADIGVPGEALKLISIFRAPAYNRGIGSNAFGRHIYGDAFDFYIDLEGDGKASDLNRDGKLDRRDAYPVVKLIEDLQAEGAIPMGGIGVYNTVGGDHVVTMHVDLRGHRAIWGYLYGAGGKRSDFCWASKRFAHLDAKDEEEAAARAAKEGKQYHRPRREPLP